MNRRNVEFLLIFWLLLSGCQAPEPSHLRVGLATAPVTLDPRFATDATSARINRLLYRALVDFDQSNLRPVPALATWEQQTPLRYRFHLGQTGRQFHNGHYLTATDVKATYEFILEASHASPHCSSLANIEKIVTPDEDTIDFLLTKPDTLFPGRLVVGIVPAELIQSGHPFNKQPVGTGAFRIVDWSQSSRLQLQRQRDNQIVEFLEVKDPIVRTLKLVRGEIDLLQGDLSPELVTWLAQRPEVEVTTREGTSFAYLGFNLQDPLMKQLAIRQAIVHALNREDIIHYVLGNAARPASSILPPAHWTGHPTLFHYQYAPEKSKTLLAPMGYNRDHPLHLVYKTSNNPFRVRIATVIQQQLAEVGIALELRTYDWGTFYGDIKAGRFQMFSLAWIGVKMPDIFRYAFHSDALPPNGANRGRLQDVTVDQFIEQAEQAATLEEQTAIYRNLQVYLLEQLPYIPLWYEDQVLVINRRIKGYTLSLDGNYDGLHTVMFD